MKSTFPRLVGAAVKATLSSALKCQSRAPLLGLATLRDPSWRFAILFLSTVWPNNGCFQIEVNLLFHLVADSDFNLWSAFCTLTRSRTNYNFKLLFRFCEAGFQNGLCRLFAAVTRCVSAFLATRRYLSVVQDRFSELSPSPKNRKLQCQYVYFKVFVFVLLNFTPMKVTCLEYVTVWTLPRVVRQSSWPRQLTSMSTFLTDVRTCVCESAW